MHFNRNIGMCGSLSAVYQPINEILTKNTLKRYITTLQSNNLVLFQQGIIFNKIFNTDSLTMYCLSATLISGRPEPVLMGKRGTTQADPFSYSPIWNFLERAVSYDYFVNDDVATMLISTQSRVYEVSASFEIGYPMAIVNDNVNIVPNTNLHIDGQGTIFAANSEYIYMYKRVPNTCTTYQEVDKISNNYGSFIKMVYGRNYRAHVKLDQIAITNKETTEEFVIYTPRNFDTVSFVTATLDSYTDILLIIAKNAYDQLLLITIDLKSTLDVYEKTLLSIEADVTNIEFTLYDSDLFYVYAPTRIEIRSVTNPKRPIGIFSDTVERLFYLKDYIWYTTYEKINKTAIKWNSNALWSNSYHNLFTMKPKHDEKAQSFYFILYNYGRIYLIKNAFDQLYTAMIPLTLSKQTLNINYDSKSYLALHLNDIFNQLTKETQQIIYAYNYDYAINFENTVPILKDYDKLTNDEFYELNYAFHENESLNSMAIYRIIYSLYNDQRALYERLNKMIVVSNPETYTIDNLQFC
jgi:hypothetical protein